MNRSGEPVSPRVRDTGQVNRSGEPVSPCVRDTGQVNGSGEPVSRVISVAFSNEALGSVAEHLRVVG